MSADIPSIDSNPEVRRFADLAQTYRQRLADLAKLREHLMLADGADDADQRAAAMLSGGQFTAPRSLASIADEQAVVKMAVARAEAAESDARAQAVIAISRECRLPEQAGQLRENIAVAIDGLLDALAESECFADKLQMADISPTGARWPGCGDDRLQSLLAAHRLDLGDLPADRLEAVERRAGRRSESPIVPERPAPAAKQTMRRKIADKLDEVGELMIG